MSTGSAPPTAMPRMIGYAAENDTAPVMLSACRMPTAAADDWMIAVKTTPTSTPSSGLENFVSRAMNVSLSRRGLTASLMAVMPNISTAKPSRMVPTRLWVWFLLNLSRMMPTVASTPVMNAVENSAVHPPPCPSDDRLTIQPVIDVPTMEPRMMLTAWENSMRPEFTKPIAITLVADEDWISAVTPMPRRMPLRGLLVRRYSTTCSLLPATIPSPSPMRAMP